MIAVLAGGVGAARFLDGLVRVVAPADVVVVGNTGDDAEVHGLHVSPDLDTVTYTLGAVANEETGWGIEADTFRATDALGRFGVPTWFRLGDVDLATNLYRTARLNEGASLSTVTAEIARAFAIGVRLVPMSDDPLRTRLRLVGGEEVDFQEYFVHRRHEPPVEAIRFEGADSAAPAPGVLEALAEAEVVLLAPSNPLLSLGPILALSGVESTLARRRSSVAVVSPIVAGRALKGPADHLLAELGHDPSATGVARLLAPVAAHLVLDGADAALVAAIAETGMRPVVTDTVMGTREVAAALAKTALSAASWS